MCSHYQTLKDAELLLKKFGAPNKPASREYDIWPRRRGAFIRRPIEHDASDEAVPEREAVVGQWGMIPPGTRPEKLAEANKKSTFNARSETAHQLWTFRKAWAKAQRCIIPADAIFEPDWRPVYECRGERPIATRFTRADGAPLGIAGLWDRWRDAAGQLQESYTMLTINADEDPLFRDYHQASKEKRMIVILPEGAYEDWLTAPVADTRDFLLPYPAERLVAEPQPK
ncbi:SOS response-associated peptidase [Achromobacter xylosoxidans]|uniref:SOS response-associated peptidase n=1 Tax=Alcaligenes xylosoxydans xylosoxydans TaxID=85698 RepID=UPI001F12F855|nr:SOS response-associated peptidase family protein [Achromobacter xylosoxidans]